MIDYLKNKEKFRVTKKKPLRKEGDFASSAQPELQSVESGTLTAKTNSELDLQYKDLSGLSMKKLSWGMWYIENKNNLISARNLILGFIGGVCWLYFIYVFGLYAVSGLKHDNEMIGDIFENIPSHQYFLALAAVRPVISPVKVYDSQSGKYDFSIKISNPNPDFAAIVEYHLESRGGSFAFSKDFILPDQSKYFTHLGEELAFFPQATNLIVDRIAWERINPHKYGIWQRYRGEHLDNLKVEDVNFSAASRLLTSSDSPDMGSLTFSVSNKTPYNYRKASFIILFKGAGGLIGVNKYTMDNLDSESRRDISMSMPDLTSNVTSIEIIPDIDILDPENYNKF